MQPVLLLLLAVASVTGRWVQMESDVRVISAPSDWTNLGPAPTEHHRVIFALKHDEAKLKELDRIFWEVSDPKHPNYGNYLTYEQSNELMAAPQLHIEVVNAYIAGFGVKGELHPQRDMIIVEAECATLEKMLSTKLSRFQLDDGAVYIRATESYYLPEEVAAVVDLVANLLDFPRFNRPRIVEGPNAVGNWSDSCGASCHGKIVPEVLRQQYSITPSTPVNTKNSMAVAEFQAQHWDQPDLDRFTTACNLPKITVNDVYGNNKPNDCTLNACIEALLDIEFLGGVAGSIPLSDYWQAQYSLYDWMAGVLAQSNPSLVHSVSYGNDEVQQTSTAYMNSVNTQFQTAASRGLTIMFASGDQGVWGRSGRGTGRFNPDFPAASPYVTAVGGSDLSAGYIGASEVCCTDSGGGFSNTFARPSYQDAAVTAYLSNPNVNLPSKDLYNATSRAYPDISAIFGLYIPYCIASGGGWLGVAGTSASAPVTAAAIANLNNIQLNAGKAPLGFINPWLYQTLAAHPDAFHDVTQGINNAGAGAGFEAATGWDPCTGVGTPIMSKMAQYLP